MIVLRLRCEVQYVAIVFVPALPWVAFCLLWLGAHKLSLLCIRWSVTEGSRATAGVRQQTVAALAKL